MSKVESKEHADRSYMGYERKRGNDIRILISETREIESTLTKMKENVRKIGFDKEGQEFGFKRVMFGVPIRNLRQKGLLPNQFSSST